MRKVIETVGKTMTNRRVTRLVFDGSGTSDIEAVRAALTPSRDWAWLEREARLAQNTLDAIEQGETGEDGENIFRPHHGAGWYSKEILGRIKSIERARDENQLHELALNSFNMAVLLTELRMKIAWEHDVDAALNTEEGRSRGGSNSCKVHPEFQLSTWKAFFAQTGKRKESDRLAAERLGIAESTIRRTRRLAEMGAATSD
jgi:hypothetical protein